MNDSPTILIVDDHLTAREVLRGLLASSGYTLIFASSGAEALATLTRQLPDLILLDVMMPEMDGFEVCQRLKSTSRWQHIPVILVTALDSQDDLVCGLDAGADDFLSKPVNGPELLARVRSMLRIKHQYEALERKQQALETSLHLNQKFSQIVAQHVEALEVLHRAGMRFMKDNLSLDSVLSLVPQTALDLISEATGCVIHLLAEDGVQLLPVVFRATDNTKMVYVQVGIEEIVRQVIETGKALHIPDVTRTSLPTQLQFPQLRSLLVTPLTNDQQRLGALSLYSAEPDMFTTNHGYVLSILADQAAVTISKARFFKEQAHTQEQEKQLIRELFQRYVSPVVVERLIDGRETLSLGGKRQEITVLFADIRGFTNFSEKLAPELLVKVLNQYLSLAVEPILAQDGTLDKFMGDAVMALYNAPLPQADHTLRAARSALAMQRAIADYNKGQRSQRYLEFGTGIHVGKAIVGNIGTAQQMNYTAVGDTVNLAKRLQENSRGGQIVLSQRAYEAIKDRVVVRKLGSLTVKGRTRAETTYELLDLT